MHRWRLSSAKNVVRTACLKSLLCFIPLIRPMICARSAQGRPLGSLDWEWSRGCLQVDLFWWIWTDFLWFRNSIKLENSGRRFRQRKIQDSAAVPSFVQNIMARLWTKFEEKHFVQTGSSWRHWALFQNDSSNTQYVGFQALELQQVLKIRKEIISTH